jgi:hypothetical protein
MPIRCNSRQIQLSLLMVFLGFLAASVGYAADVVSLFAPVPAAQRQAHFDSGMVAAASADDEHVLDIDFEVLSSGVITTGMLLRVEPAPDVVFTASVQRVGLDVNNVYGLMAPLQGHAFAHFTISVDGTVALGEVFVPESGQRYLIRYEPASELHVARKVAEQDLDRLPSGPSLRVPAPEMDEKVFGVLSAGAQVEEDELLANPLEQVTIDLMIVYTPAAASWATSNQGSINNVINQAMTRAQQALDNSQTYITLRLVHSAQVSYTESGNSGTDLTRLQNPTDGHMDVVHTWRNTYGADVISIFTFANDTGGLGYALESQHLPGGFPNFAFNMTRIQQAHNTYTMIHEIGHNMGAGHHYQQNFQTGPQLYSYSSGWRWQSGPTWYNSIMAYSQGSYYDAPAPGAGITSIEVGHFSNPSVNYAGVPTGHATHADNARTMRQTKHLTAAYRATVIAPPSGKNIGFRAIALDNRVMLRWNDPRNHDFGSATVHIRSSTSGYPASLGDGSLVYEGSAQHFLHDSNITPGVPHYYTIWVSNDGTSFIVP